ncbi:MAG: polysaccharide biosynthesis/export family protein [Planctomycetota bacterium]
MPIAVATRLKRYAVAASLLGVAMVAYAVMHPAPVEPTAKKHSPKPAAAEALAKSVTAEDTAFHLPSSAFAPSRQIPGRPGSLSLCQALGPAAPFPIWGVDGTTAAPAGEVGWDSRAKIEWQRYAQGEYVGHARLAHVPEYRLRVDDQLSVFYLRTREVQSRAYELQVGDQLRIESLTGGASLGAGTQPGGPNPSIDDGLNRDLVIQPDGKIVLPLIDPVPAAGKTVSALQQELERRYKRLYKNPSITVTPLVVNTKLEDLISTVDARGSIAGGLQIAVVVTPAGKIQLPALGSVYVQGLTLAEAKMEIDSRYAQTIPGISVTVDLTERAQRFIYVLGEVEQGGQFELEGPTTVMQAIALAGGWTIGANLRQVVVFRRGPDWRLMATMVDVAGALYARRPAPADEIWLNDSDIILVPKTPIEVVDEVIEQYFTRAAYAAVPLEIFWGQGFSSISTVTSF